MGKKKRYVLEGVFQTISKTTYSGRVYSGWPGLIIGEKKRKRWKKKRKM